MFLIRETSSAGPAPSRLHVNSKPSRRSSLDSGYSSALSRTEPASDALERRSCSSDDSTMSQEAAPTAQSAVEFTRQAEKLSLQPPQEGGGSEDVAVQAKFVTPQDAVIITAEGNRLPGVPLQEAHKLNTLRDEIESGQSALVKTQEDGDKAHGKTPGKARGKTLENEIEAIVGSAPSEPRNVINIPSMQNGKALQKSSEGTLQKAMPPSHTNPLFPPLPLYGPPSLLRDIQCYAFRASAFFLSLSFLGVIVLGALFTSIPRAVRRTLMRLTFRDPDENRPFYEEEVRMREKRREQERQWKRRSSQGAGPADRESIQDDDNFVPTEGGPDPIICDVAYYARRVGLDVEEFQVQTEDGFLIDLWHVYDPKEYVELPGSERRQRGPDLFTGEKRRRLRDPSKPKKYPVLLMHGLLQSAGAYCVNDDQSLAFYLCKSGYDVWLGNNRCGFKPNHVLLDPSDPRMWCWNIRQMGVFDLPALTSRVLYETGFEKLGLVAHSQGTTQTFVALAKEQRPDLGDKLSVFCALAPAAYAGPLIGKMYFKFMRVITPGMFRMLFGIHAFIPFMMDMHALLPGRLYGWLGYKVFSFLFNWSDTNWDKGLRDRFFRFAPVYVSAESMRWWLGRECFAKHKCILATKEEWRAEEREDNEAAARGNITQEEKAVEREAGRTGDSTPASRSGVEHHRRKTKGSTAWYDSRAPPFALWVCGRDELVDGRKLLRRFERGREPHVKVVHQKVIADFEHLDVLWAINAEEEVFREVREVLWKTCPDRGTCRVPKGCENVAQWVPEPQSKHKAEANANEGAEGAEGELSSQSGSSSSSEDLSS